MDKILGVFTAIFVGIPLTIISFLISWGMNDDRCDKTTLRDDSDMRVYVPVRCRSRGRNNRRIKQVDSEGREICKEDGQHRK